MTSILRESFIPTFSMENENSKLFLKYDSIWGLHYGIKQTTTNGLGYEPIRDKKERAKTPEDLQNHLRKMDKQVEESEYELFSTTTFALVRCIHELEKETNEQSKVIKSTKTLINQLLDLGYIEYKPLNECGEKEVPKTKTNKKGFLERIFN